MEYDDLTENRRILLLVGVLENCSDFLESKTVPDIISGGMIHLDSGLSAPEDWTVINSRLSLIIIAGFINIPIYTINALEEKGKLDYMLGGLIKNYPDFTKEFEKKVK